MTSGLPGVVPAVCSDNVDECQDVASQLGVRGIPTLAVYKDGQLQAQQAGAMNSAQFSEFLKNFI